MSICGDHRVVLCNIVNLSHKTWILTESLDGRGTSKRMPHDGSCFHVKATFELIKVEAVVIVQHVFDTSSFIEQVKDVQGLFGIESSLLHLLTSMHDKNR